MPVFTQNKSNISLSSSLVPKRIVSLVPSQTELLFDLGLDEEVVGITKFCIHPQSWLKKKHRVGGTKTVKTDVVRALQPDLIIANKEENVKEQVEELSLIAPVVISDIQTLDDALDMIIFVGRVVDREKRSTELAGEIKGSFENLTTLKKRTNVVYLIWKDPYMAAGGDTFIHHMLSRCGFVNNFEKINRYPKFNPEKFPFGHVDKTCLDNEQILLLSSEPYPFKQKHVEELQKILPSTRILLVDGEAFSWYGSRLRHSAEYFEGLIRQIQG